MRGGKAGREGEEGWRDQSKPPTCLGFVEAVAAVFERENREERTWECENDRMTSARRPARHAELSLRSYFTAFM